MQTGWYAGHPTGGFGRRGGSHPDLAERLAVSVMAHHAPSSRGSRRMPWLTWTALGVVWFTWGSAYLAIRVMVRDIPPLFGNGIRFVVCGLVLMGITAVMRPQATITPDRRGLWEFTVLGLLICGLSGGFLGLGEQHVNSSIAALIGASLPFWLIVLQAMSGHRPTARDMGAAAIGFVGVGLLFLPSEGEGSTSLLGGALILGSTLSWALGSWLTPRLRPPDDVLVATSWQMLLGGLALVVIGIAAGDLGRMEVPSLESSLAYVYLTTISGVVGYVAYVWLLHNATLTQVGTFAYVNPMVAVVLGWAILGESLTALGLLASVVIIGSVVLTLQDGS